MAKAVAPTLSAAHAQMVGIDGAGIAAAWMRPPGSSRYEIVIGGHQELPGFDPGLTRACANDVPVLFPPGATGRPADNAWIVGQFEGFPYWVKCFGGAVPKVGGKAVPGEDVVVGGGLDDYVAHLYRPFAWIAIAEPLANDSIEDELEQLALTLTVLKKRETSEDARHRIERHESEYRELSRARHTGLWNLRVLVGSDTPAGARQSAALLCSAGELEDLDRSMYPSQTVADLASSLLTQEDGPSELRAPFLAASETASRLVRGPARELPGFRLVAAPEFDVTPDIEVDRSCGVDLGFVLDAGLQPAQPFTVSLDSLNRHGFICGATGSGKSQTARGLLEQLASSENPVPWLVIEPAKAEYARISSRLPEGTAVLAIRPGDLDTAPAALNPLEPEPNFPLQSHADLVRALFLAAFEANEPFPQVLSRALTNCYVAAGWDLVTSAPQSLVRPKLHRDEPDRAMKPHYPTLSDLQQAARQVVDEIGYGSEVASDVRGFVDVRLGSLRQGSPGRFFEGGHPLDIAELLRRNVVLELDTITNDQDKAFLIGTVLIRIVEHLRVRARHKRAEGLEHLLLIEEAHRLLKNVDEGPAAGSVQLFASLLAEIRAYGEGVVVVEQIPSKILPDVIKNTAVKIVHRLPAKDDRDAVGATMNLQTNGHETVVALPPGRAAVAADGWDRPLLVQVNGGMTRESADTAEICPPLSGRRSDFCGSACRSRACRLNEMASALAAAHDPYVVVWSEVTAAAIVMGLHPPQPRSTVLKAWSNDDRIRACMLATRVDTAVAARRGRISRWVDPDDFGLRLHETLAAALAGQPPPAADVRRWRSGPYRWASVHAALDTAIDQVGGLDDARRYHPHPDTDEWRQLGLDLDGESLAEQYEQLLRDPAYALHSERTALGDTLSSGLERAVLDLAGATGPRWFSQAIALTCTGDDLELLIDQIASHLSGNLHD